MSIVKHLSTTLVQGYPLCPARAMEQYARRIEEGNFDGAEPTRFGSIVHEVCERVHQAHMAGVEVENPVEVFRDLWRKSAASDYEYYILGMEGIEEFLDRTLYDRAGDTIGVEVRFLIDLNNMRVWLHDDANPKNVLRILAKGHVPLISTIDRIDYVDKGIYEITDYKTNYMPYTRWEVDNSVQLGIYDVVTRLIYPDAEEVRCVFDLVRWGRQPTTFDEQQREVLVAYLIDMWHQIEQTDVYEEKINRYCRNCERRTRCGAFIQVINDPLPNGFLFEDSEEGLARAFDELDTLKNKQKIIEARAKEIEEGFAQIFGDNGGQPIPMAGRAEAYYSPNPRYDFDARTVWEIFKRYDALTLFRDSVSVKGKQAMERILKGRGQMKAEIMGTMNKRFVKPTLRRRRLGSTEQEIETDE